MESSIKEENKRFESNGDEENGEEGIVFKLGDQLGSSRAELNEAMEENQRLKTYLDRILKDYRTLQMKCQDIIPADHRGSTEGPEDPISLSLAISSPINLTKDEQHRKSPTYKNVDNVASEGSGDKDGLGLGLDCKTFQVPPRKPPVEHLSSNRSPENSSSEGKREARDDEMTQQNPAKRARVSVRVRCDTPTMNDGCHWRKYGQKMAKGNPCPRAYYRCTVVQSCPVRKQVQRCAEDMSILITTYEGTHNHPLSISATALASTTAAAASMLTLGPSNSSTDPCPGPSPSPSPGPGPGPGPSSSHPIAYKTLNGLNFYPSHDNTSSKPYYLSNPTISSTPSYPTTITLDLTSSSTSSLFMSSHSTQMTNFPPRVHSTTNLNFSSFESNMVPMSWDNGTLTYGPNQTPNKNQNQSNPSSESLSFGAHEPYENLYRTYLQQTNIATISQQNGTSDAIAAATKAITSDPSFQSALVAALSSFMGLHGSNANEGQKSSQVDKVKIGEPNYPILSSFPLPASNANKCVSSFSNKLLSNTSTLRPLMLCSTPFSSVTSESSSPSDPSRDRAV